MTAWKRIPCSRVAVGAGVQFMKSTYPVSKKARAISSWHKHLRKTEKRRVNKSTRKLFKSQFHEDLLKV